MNLSSIIDSYTKKQEAGLGQLDKQADNLTLAAKNRRSNNFATLANLRSTVLENPSAAADSAALGTRGAFDKSREVNSDMMARMGINPGSGQFADQMKGMATAEASAVGSAMSDAARNQKRVNFSNLQSLAALENNLEAGALNQDIAAANLKNNIVNQFGSIAGDAASVSAHNAEFNRLDREAKANRDLFLRLNQQFAS